MKLRLLIFLFAWLCLSLEGQHLSTAYINGSLSGSVNGIYGTQGVNSNSKPEALGSACMWSDGTAIYLFGGEVNTSSLGDSLIINNRLWQWTEANSWSLVSGDLGNVRINNSNQNEVNLGTVNYGTKGVASASNQPGARAGAAYVTGNNGEFYMYGGYGVASDGLGALSDLWKYENGLWTWIGGSSLKDVAATYGTLLASGGSEPGARVDANLWVDGSDDIFIFGGGTGFYGQYHDNYASVMRFNGTDWSWRIGSSALNAGPVQASGSTTYIEPAARRAAAGVYIDGKFYLKGGAVDQNPGEYREQSDYWSYDGQGWTLIVGDPGTDESDNETGSGAFCGAVLLSLNDVIYHKGGLSRGEHFSASVYSVYKWQDTIFNRLNSTAYLEANPGLYQSALPVLDKNRASSISNRHAATIHNNEAYFYGTQGHSAGSSDLFAKFNGEAWAYISGGESPENYISGTQSKPGARAEAAYIYDEDAEKLYLFGGNAFPESGYRGRSNDFWQYSNGQWVWLSGSKTSGSSSVYGTYQVPAAANTPGARVNAQMWIDGAGDIWLFGGYGKDENGDLGYLNDLWKYSNGQWSWERGSKLRNQQPVSGAFGVADASYTPGAKVQAVTWRDANNDLYLFGGLGTTSTGSTARTNGLWKWDGSNWSMEAGSTSANGAGSYGTKGVSAPSNYPSARSACSFWGDEDVLYLYGGQGISSIGGFGYLDQLWKYDRASGEWTWLSGTGGSLSVSAAYGESTDNTASVNPGNLRSAILWSNNGTDLFLFGGIRLSPSLANTFVPTNNLWHWDGSNWAWLKGDQNSSYSNMTAEINADGEFSFSNLPSARASAVAWSSDNGFYLWGGLGVNSNGTSNISFNDFWIMEEGNAWDGSDWTKGKPSVGVSDVLIRSNTTPAAALSTKDLIVDANFSFDLDSHDLEIAGNIYNYGDWIDMGTITLNGETDQYLNGSRWDMDGLLLVNSNSTFHTNDSLRIKANSTTDFGQLYSTGQVSGSLEFQYYLDLQSFTHNGRFFQMGSTLDGVEIGDFAQGGILNTGNANASVNTVWTWAAHAAEWQSPASGLTQEGLGYSFYAGHNSSGNFIFQDGTQAAALTIRGTYRYNSFGSYTLNYNDGQSSSVTFNGGTHQDQTQGWNLLCNPFTYSVTIESMLNSSSVNDAIYYYHAASPLITHYASYVNGVGANGGSAVIAPGQAFFVQCTTGPLGFLAGTSPAYSSNTERFKRSDKDLLRLKLLHSSMEDEVVVSFDFRASKAFDSQFDAWNLSSPSTPIDLAIVSRGDVEFAIGGFSPDSIDEIFLSPKMNVAGDDSLVLSADASQLSAFNQVYLFDHKLDIIHDLNLNPNYHFKNDSSFQEKRFQLFFGHNSGLGIAAKELNKLPLYAYQNEAGNFLRWINKRPSGKVKLKVFAANGVLIEDLAWLEEERERSILRTAKTGIYIIQLIDAQGEIYSLKVLKKPQ